MKAIPPSNISHGAKLPTPAASTAGKANIPAPIMPLIGNRAVPQKPIVRGGAGSFEVESRSITAGWRETRPRTSV